MNLLIYESMYLVISPGGGILDLVLHGKYLCKYCVQECPPNL